jgi:hypothetical protein
MHICVLSLNNTFCMKKKGKPKTRDKLFENTHFN